MRWLKRILVFLLVVVLALGVFGFWTVRRSFPTVQGELAIRGLSEPVTVIRDDWGIAHIYATNSHDLFFAQGYTHAQERFWQMDFQRHIGAARLSEIFGESQFETDKFLRSLGLVELAQYEYANGSDELVATLDAYAAGVNAYLADHSGAEISLEYAILPLINSGYEIEPWSPTDTLTWAKMMSWELSGNMDDEIARTVLSATLPLEQIEKLWPPYPEDHPVIVESDQVDARARTTIQLPDAAIEAVRSVGEGVELVSALTGGGFEGVGSNNWAVSGDMTGTGMPILANDTHLGIQMPSIWFQQGLHCVGNDPECDTDVVGFMFVGAPGVVIGHNDRIAWGVTTEAADTQDLFVEKVNPDNPNQYEVDGEWVDFEVRTEVIEIAGSQPEEIVVRSTRHGPVISGTYVDVDAFDDATATEVPEEYVVALAWQSLQPATLMDAVLALGKADDYDDFRSAMALWDVAAQNVVYADVDGNIAYQSTGEIPVRAQGVGSYPVPGWTSEYDWVGIVPFEDMPSVLNPPQGYVATANQMVTRPGVPPLIAPDGAFGFRANRIEDLITAVGDHDVEYSQQMQMDAFDGGALDIVPALLGVDAAGNGAVAEMQSLLETWASDANPFQAVWDSSEAAAYQGAWRHLLINTFHDQMPEDLRPSRANGNSRWFEVVIQLLDSPDDPWWDDVNTAAVESRDDVLFQSMIDGHEELTDLLGDNPADWRWGDLHIARFENQTLGQSGIGPVEWLFNRTAPPRVGGGGGIVNATGWGFDEGYELDWHPSQRMVVDFSDFSRSTYINTTGNSGHAFHRYYDNMIEAWTDGDQAPMYWTRDEVELNATSTLELIPAG